MFIHMLKDQLGNEKVSQNETALFACSHDESPHQAVEPEVVCFPESREDIEKILEIARTYHVPVTSFGAGSGLEGQAIPIQRGIVIHFEKMNKVVDFSPEDMTMTVHPGLIRQCLIKIVNRHVVIFPVDHGTALAIGVMAAVIARGSPVVR